MVNDPKQEMERIWNQTCGSWENCNEENIQSFLSQCEEKSIDPQYCMSWVEQHSNQIPNWSDVSKVSLEWVNEHTSTGGPFSGREPQ
ncbi:hypothetical protein M3182_03270 [Mesobacillus maritimus]|uniref:hypothetical protein n=1 Tax=Mesobacillus maritimus TaxID=1643336 RepID=UPI00203E4A06|nr:hypothetical protein [Mesobacillus maritimus]MCM3584765.1 hypothetical protein [Mesobacillus maritimus]MCM3671869.1 hypothetical protein [Mesobacillus maritimus]